MTGIQEWFAPLLWIAGTITTLGAFIRFCKPVWKIFTAPTEMIKKIDQNTKQDEENFKALSNELSNLQIDVTALRTRLDKTDQIQLSLLHDQIIQIHQQAIADGEISDSNYRRAHELYANNGGSDYIKTLMDELMILHNQTVKKELK